MRAGTARVDLVPVRYTRTTFGCVRSNAATDPYLVLPSLFTSCRSTLVDVVVVLVVLGVVLGPPASLSDSLPNAFDGPSSTSITVEGGGEFIVVAP